MNAKKRLLSTGDGALPIECIDRSSEFVRSAYSSDSLNITTCANIRRHSCGQATEFVRSVDVPAPDIEMTSSDFVRSEYADNDSIG